MLQLVRKTFQVAAAPSDIIDRAKSHATDVRNVLISSKNLMRLLEAGTPVCANEVVGLIDKAEKINLISREGMKQSGHFFIVHENEMKMKMFDITADEAMSSAHHMYLQARRANNIINRKPGAYTPPASGQLYGPNINGWAPLIP